MRRHQHVTDNLRAPTKRSDVACAPQSLWSAMRSRSFPHLSTCVSCVRNEEGNVSNTCKFCGKVFWGKSERIADHLVTSCSGRGGDGELTMEEVFGLTRELAVMQRERQAHETKPNPVAALWRGRDADSFRLVMAQSLMVAVANLPLSCCRSVGYTGLIQASHLSLDQAPSPYIVSKCHATLAGGCGEGVAA